MEDRRRTQRLDAFGQVFEPKEAVEPILSERVGAALLEWITEIWAEDELREIGIGPRRKTVFDGPPGVGKTTMAHHLAARLGLRMLAVRPERVISKFVGETGERIGEMFDLCSHKDDPVVLFLDEFDSYSRQRRRSQQASDDSRNDGVNTLLQRLEQHDGFVIAATNFGAHIDQAIWRRFDLHISLELPGQAEREKILARYLNPFGLPRRALAELATSFETGSPALMRQFCENLKRALVVGPKLNLDMRREAVIGRIIASVKPHPDLGLPRLWSAGESDAAIKLLPWPLPRAADVVEQAEASTADAEELGRHAARTGRPVIENPFPFGDPRRARFDEGYRRAGDKHGGGDVVKFPGGSA